MASILAMHMANELLSIPVAAGTLAVAAAAVWLAARRARRTLDPEKLPLMGVMGAFVFAAQMINFTLPGMPGTSGHLGGGVLLAILLGPAAAIVTMTSILIVQCLLFQDGGLLALGCNIINMGVVPCLLGWGVWRGLAGRGGRAGAWRQYSAAWAASVLAVCAGAALVPIESALAGVLRIPVGHFLAVMVGVHVVIGGVEGLITFAVIAYLRQVRPASLGLLGSPDAQRRLGGKAVAASLIGTALLLGGVVSWFASSRPDGLEWSYRGHDYGKAAAPVAAPSQAVAAVERFQTRYSPMPDYTRRASAVNPVAVDEAGAEGAWPNVDGWRSLAGVVGTAVTLLVVYALAMLLRKRARAAAQVRRA